MKTETKATAVVNPSPATETKTVPTNQTRKFVRTELPTAYFPGAQRRIVLQAITEHEGPASALDLVEKCTKLGLQSKTPIAASAAYHLHHLNILGYVKVV